MDKRENVDTCLLSNTSKQILDLIPKTVLMQQVSVCTKYGTLFLAASPRLLAGGSASIGEAIYPLNGLRHRQERGTTGWYIWRGEKLSDSPNFFRPIHTEHFPSLCPEALPFLGLPEGWRFLLAPNYEDIWFDQSLLNE